jgi:hypothetical protein
MDVLFSFDTTGSMSSCIYTVRQKLTETVNRLFSLIPDIRIGVIAHGDYCDAYSSYVTSILDFTKDKDTIVNFVKSISNTGGGDYAECYELVLHQAQSLNWQSKERLMVLIADAYPHGKNENQNYLHLDWMEEADLLIENGINIQPIQCLHEKRSDYFYDYLAQKSNLNKLTLDQFADIVEFILAIAYKQVGQLENYQQELESSFRMNRSLARMFEDLGTNVKVKEVFTKKVNDLIPVDPSRFQVLLVNRECSIRTFVESNGIVYRAGRGFYQFTKSEEIQERKEVILQHKLTGDFFTGEKVREMIGLPFGVRGTIRPKYFEEYNVFVQSTSYNRKLLNNTKFLYEAKE